MNKKHYRLQALALALGLMASLSGAVALANPDTGAAAADQPAVKKEYRGGKHGHFKKGHRKPCAMMKQLNLTDAQKEALKTKKEAFRKDNAATFEALRKQHQELRGLGDDPANAARKAELKKDLKAQRMTMMEQHKAIFQSVLTPEQQEQLQKMKAERRAKWEQMRKDKSGKSSGGEPPTQCAR